MKYVTGALLVALLLVAGRFSGPTNRVIIVTARLELRTYTRALLHARSFVRNGYNVVMVGPLNSQGLQTDWVLRNALQTGQFKVLLTLVSRNIMLVRNPLIRFIYIINFIWSFACALYSSQNSKLALLERDLPSVMLPVLCISIVWKLVLRNRKILVDWQNSNISWFEARLNCWSVDHNLVLSSCSRSKLIEKVCRDKTPSSVTLDNYNQLKRLLIEEKFILFENSPADEFVPQSSQKTPFFKAYFGSNQLLANTKILFTHINPLDTPPDLLFDALKQYDAALEQSLWKSPALCLLSKIILVISVDFPSQQHFVNQKTAQFQFSKNITIIPHCFMLDDLPKIIPAAYLALEFQKDSKRPSLLVNLDSPSETLSIQALNYLGCGIPVIIIPSSKKHLKLTQDLSNILIELFTDTNLYENTTNLALAKFRTQRWEESWKVLMSAIL